jgi:hypothetical protein
MTETDRARLSDAAEKCTCWLGTDSTLGSSDQRQACAVHGDPPAPRPDVDAVGRYRMRHAKYGIDIETIDGPEPSIDAEDEVWVRAEDHVRVLAAAAQARQLAEDFAAQAEMHANDLLQQFEASEQARADAQQAWCTFTKTHTDQHAKELAAAHQARADAERERDNAREGLANLQKLLSIAYHNNAAAYRERNEAVKERDELHAICCDYLKHTGPLFYQPWGPWFRAALAKM